MSVTSYLTIFLLGEREVQGEPVGSAQGGDNCALLSRGALQAE